LHKDTVLLNKVRMFDYEDFIKETALNHAYSTFNELNLCIPFVWRELGFGGFKRVLLSLEPTRASAAASVILFAGKYIGLDSIEVYLSLGLKNVTSEYVMSNEESLRLMMKISSFDKHFIEESNLPLDAFSDILDYWTRADSAES